MASKSYSQIPHYWTVSIIPDGVTGPVYGGVVARGTDFDGKTKLKSDDVTGHTGTKSLKLISDRTSMTAEPEYEHKAIFGELFEDYWKMLLGSHTTSAATAITPSSGTGTLNVYDWSFYQDIANPKELPHATLINGYNPSTTVQNSARLYDNALMSELGLTISDKGITLKPKWVSNAPLIHQPNPTRTFAGELDKLGVDNTHIYMADCGTNLLTKTGTELDPYDYGCIIKSENTWNTNPSEDACIGNTFGESNADEGEFEDKGKLEVKWNPNSDKILSKWYTGSSTGTAPTTESLFQEILITMRGKQIGTTTGETPTPVYEYCNVYMPKIEITDCKTQESGDKTKTIEMEYDVRQNGTDSALTVNMKSRLEALHYGTAAKP